jgi:energy-coupling factor transporter transmembrane protein EcfT
MKATTVLLAICGLVVVVVALIAGWWAIQAMWLTAADVGGVTKHEANFRWRALLTAALLVGAGLLFRRAWRSL